MRIEGEHSGFQNIKRGVRQGCVMSPDLVNLYSEMILRNSENIQGLKTNGEKFNNLRYADDTVLIPESEQQLQRLLDTVVLEGKNGCVSECENNGMHSRLQEILTP